MHERPERHALTRLRERHNIEMTREELCEIDRRLATPEFRRDGTLCRYVQAAPVDKSIWQVNLRPYFGMTLWVTVVYDGPRRWVMTVLPVPLNVSADEARWLIGKHYRERSRAKAAEQRLAIGA